MPSSRSTPSAFAAACRRSRSRGLHASVRSGKRGPRSSALGPISGFWPVRLMWSRMTMSVPGPKDGSSPPAAFVRTTTLAPSRWNSRTGWTTSPGWLPSYRWNRPWSMTTGLPPSVPSNSRPACPGAVAEGQPGMSRNGMATAFSRSSARPPRPDPSTIPTSGTNGVNSRTAASSIARWAGWPAGGMGRAGSRRRPASEGSGRSVIRTSRVFVQRGRPRPVAGRRSWPDIRTRTRRQAFGPPEHRNRCESGSAGAAAPHESCSGMSLCLVRLPSLVT